jgi:TolB-like protein/DNA-binding SARP family transcriptional activator/tetratricopeptide (TPR) repeat protein
MEQAKPMGSLHLKLLGGFAACSSSGTAVHIRGKKNQALLAYLAVNIDKGLTREKAIGLLWSDRDDSHARSTLRQVLFSLRRDLAAIHPAPLEFNGDTVAVNAKAVSTDVARFERLAASGSAADLQVATTAYEGEFLDGIAVQDLAFEEWLAIQRVRFHEMIINVYLSLLPHLSGSEAVVAASRLVALDQLRDSSHRALMQAYAGQGHFEPAIRQYHICRDILWRDLHIRPAAETEDLYRSIREARNRSSTTEDAQRGVGRDKPSVVVLKRAFSSEPNVTPAAPRDTQQAELPSIAVLPFIDMSGDSDGDHLGDGIAEDIITGLSRFRGLVVIARDSSLRFRVNAANLQGVAMKLGVHFIVVGSIRHSADRIRINVQLVNATTGNHLWADRYDGPNCELGTIQDELIETIVAKITGRIRLVEAGRARRMRCESMTAYDCLVRGRQHMRNLSREETVRARYWFERSLERDPNYASALAWLAKSKGHESLFGQSTELFHQAVSLARKAIAIDPDDGFTHAALGAVQLDGLSHGVGSHAIAAQELEAALRLNPNDPDLMVNRALQYTYSGQADAALRLVERAERLNPSLPNHYLSNRGFALFELHRYEEGADAFEAVTSPAYWDHYYLAACCAYLGREREARRHVARTIEKAPFLTLSSLSRRSWYADSVDREHLLEGLRSAGMAA